MSDRTICDRDIAIKLVHELFEYSKEKVSGVPEISHPLIEEGYDPQQVRRVIENLKAKGLLVKSGFAFGYRASGLLSPDAIDRMQQGESAEDIVVKSGANSSESHTWNISGDSPQVNVRSPYATQNNYAQRGDELDRLLTALREAITATPDVPEEEVRDALADADALESQLKKSKPNKAVIDQLIKAFKELPWVVKGSLALEEIIRHVSTY